MDWCLLFRVSALRAIMALSEDESRIVGIREAKMAILDSSSLKRSLTLRNRNRADRIRDEPFTCRR